MTHLKEMNYGSYGGMGEKVPFSFMEIESFMRVTRTDLSRWEIFALRQLSLEYIAQTQKRNKEEMPPYMEVDEYTYLMSLK